MYVAIGVNCWGKGESKDQAIRRARVRWPSSMLCKHRAVSENFNVLETSEDAWVDEFGTVHAKTIKRVQISKLAAA